MSCQIFLVIFLLLFVCCKLCEQGCAAQSGQAPAKTNENTFDEFFTKEEIKKTPDLSSILNKENIVMNVESVFLAAADDVMVALASVNYEDGDKEYINYLAKCTKISKEIDWGKSVIEKKSVSDWETHLVKINDKYLKKENKIKSSAVVVNGKKIYNFFVTNSAFQNGDVSAPAETQQWNTALIVGDVSGAKTQKVEINWEGWKINKFSKDKTPKDVLHLTPKTIPPVVSSGFVLNKKVVFAIQGEGKETNENKNVTAFFTLGTDNNLEFLHVENTEKCFSSLFLWEEQIVMTPTACEAESKQTIRVFDYKEGFQAIDKKVNFLQEFIKDKENFVTTKIDTETEVLLFTQQSEDSEKPKTPKSHKVYLWMTDSNRTAKVDTIITGSKENFDLSVLHTNDELFVLYNNYGTGGDVIEGKSTYNLKRLPDQLEKIKKILDAWKNTDNEIEKFFKKTDTAETLLFKDRLVGFLSGNGEDDKYWKDEYFYENATVTSGRKTSEGFTFSGAGAGAKWLVKEENKDQPYSFAAFGFTLVATVKIDKDANEKGNSILGVGLGGSEKKSIGLWCNKGVWGFGGGKNPEEATSTTETCVRDEKYRVVLTMGSNEISLYIDGKKMKGLPKNSIGVQQEALSITHFYFGVNNAGQEPQSTNIEGHVTVTNVLLYNRPFDVGEVNNLKECPKTSKINENLKEEHGTTEQKNDQPLTPRPTSSEEKKEEKAPSPSRTEDGGVGGGVRVFSLLLAVLCVSAPLLHL